MEAQFSNLKDYVLGEISALGQKIEEKSNNVKTALKKLKSRQQWDTNILAKNITVLQQQQPQSKNELIKSLIKT